MGNLVNKVAKRAVRPLKNFAVEARTEKLLAKDKRAPAPWHPSTQKKIDEYMKANPKLAEEQGKKDASLDERLKGLYVTSEDVIFPKLEDPKRPLPQMRDNIDMPVLGYTEPERVTKGKIILRHALIMIGKHQQDPSLHSAFSLANEYTIHPKVAENILKHFRAFDYYEPPKMKLKLKVQDYISLETPQQESQQANERKPKKS